MPVVLALVMIASAPSTANNLPLYQDTDHQDSGDKKSAKEKPSSKNVHGPSVGKPANIIPGPYLRKGSIKLPPRPAHLEDNQDANEFGDVQVSGEGELQTPIKRDAIIEDALIQLDPSGIAATSEDAIAPALLWGAHSRETIQAFINGLHPSGPLPTIHKLAENFIRRGQILPAPKRDDAIPQFIKTRLSALRRFGDGSTYVSLINRLPKDRDWSALSRFSAEAALVSGKLLQACTVAAEQRSESSEAYWLKMNALCYALDGNRAGVDFQIGVLEETTTISPVFYKLIDQLLIEAEQDSNSDASAPDSNMSALDIYEPFPVSILESVMARLTGASISDLSPEQPDPLAIPILISQPGLNREARVELVALGVKQNWLKLDVLKEFVETLDISTDEEALAYRLYDTDSGFLIDLALARQMANRDNSIDDRMQAFKLATDRAARNNTTAGLAKLHLALISDIAPSGDMLSYAAAVGRLSLLTGNYDLASRWFALARALPVGSNASSDTSLISLWPLMVVAGYDSDIPDVTEAILWNWWTAHADDESRFDKANRLFSVLEGLSYNIPEQAWGWLEAGPSAVSGKAIAPAHWRRFLIAAAEGPQIDLHLSLLPLFENDEIVEPALLGSVIGSLNGRGEKRLARDLALESLLHAGL